MSVRPLFGPGGNSDSFHAAGYKSTLDAPAWVAAQGLDLYEFEAGRGLRQPPESLALIGKAAAAAGIGLSYHAPYFISISSAEEEKRENSRRIIRESLEAAECLGARTIVVHCGGCAKMTREEGMFLSRDTLTKFCEETPVSGVAVGLETMGKENQLGTLEEVLSLCTIDRRFVPVVDFGHLYARSLGKEYLTVDDFRRAFDRIATVLSDDVAKNLHVHFSRIQYTDKGEKMHLTFAQEEFGPDFEPMAECIVRENLAPHIICESAGTQAEDALAMKRAWLAAGGTIA